MKKILFLFPYPSGTAASQRFRFEQYYDLLTAQGFHLTKAPFLDPKTWNILYQPGHAFQKSLGILMGFLRRLLLLFTVRKYDFVFLHREAAPLGPPVFEWLLANVFGKKIIFDFDDAIWLPNTSQENKLARFLKFPEKARLTCRWAYKISAGNGYLAAFGKRAKGISEIEPSPTVVINPTTLDTLHQHNRLKNQHSQKLIIGWTGTHSTLIYLTDLLPVLRNLEQHHDFTFLVIADKNPDFDLKSFHYLPWQKSTETDDLLQMNIGVMPLTDDAWARGKCGFKALQYMALGIPALVSPVGVNTEIVQQGINGFVCQTPEDWYTALEWLLTNPQLRDELGKNARQTVVNRYSVQSNTPLFLSLFQ